MSRIAKVFHVSYLQILNERGACNDKLMPKLSDNDVRRLYETMVLSRRFDDTALKLQREGRMSTYASVLGQEASQVGTAFALESEDWMFPTFRDMASFITLGFPMHMLYMYWGGDGRGMKIPESLNIFPVAVTVAGQIPHAVGAAWGMKLKGKKSAALVYMGDGATSKGDFHEAMNFAGVFKVPCIFVCQNNQWAISLPRARQTASETIAQKAIAYGFDGIQVDGNDIFAVVKATRDAAEKARTGGGPTFIECLTYRVSDHTTADDASRYRDAKEVEEWKKRDPIMRLRVWMQRKGIWNESYEKHVLEEADEKVVKSVKDYEAVPAPSPEDVVKYTYAEMPWNLKEQLAQLVSELLKNQAATEQKAEQKAEQKVEN